MWTPFVLRITICQIVKHPSSTCGSCWQLITGSKSDDCQCQWLLMKCLWFIECSTLLRITLTVPMNGHQACIVPDRKQVVSPENDAGITSGTKLFQHILHENCFIAQQIFLNTQLHSLSDPWSEATVVQLFHHFLLWMFHVFVQQNTAQEDCSIFPSDLLSVFWLLIAPIKPPCRHVSKCEYGIYVSISIESTHCLQDNKLTNTVWLVHEWIEECVEGSESVWEVLSVSASD